MKYQRSLNFDETTWDVVDSLRQDVTRSRYLEKIIREKIGVKNE